jgi:hypothetical protein
VLILEPMSVGDRGSFFVPNGMDSKDLELLGFRLFFSVPDCQLAYHQHSFEPV